MLSLHSTSNYSLDLYNYLKTSGIEGYRPRVYVVFGEYIATIGVGINLNASSGNLNAVLMQLGFDINGTQLTGDAWTAEQGYIEQIRQAVKSKYKTDKAVQAALDGILQKRAADTRYDQSFYRRTVFQFNNDTESYNAFNAIVGTYETSLDKWLNLTGISAAQPSLLSHNNKERLALLSLTYSSKCWGSDQKNTPWNDTGLPTILGPKLANALLNDNRAEAWYEIRYGSNGDGGHANRRYNDADQFGLYNTDPANVTEADAKEIMRMYTRYEALGGLKLSAYELSHALPSGINDIYNTVKPATDYLVANFAMGNTIDGWVIVGKGLDSYNYLEKGVWADNIIGNVNNDLIFGEKGRDILNGLAGNDVIYGGEGDDELLGGSGIDTLIGGAGSDTYVFYESELGSGGSIPDKIIDDGVGDKIIIKNAQGNIIETRSVSGNYNKQADGTWTKIVSWFGGTVNEVIKIIYDEATAIAKIILPSAEAYEIPNFQSGDFGINLMPLPTEATGYTIISLDDVDPDNVDHRDKFYGTSGSDKIYGGSGNDEVITNYLETGNDWLLGGAGNDVVQPFGDPDDCILEGNSGVDALIGSYGSDRIFCGDSDFDGDGQIDTMEQLIVWGETALSLAATGDLAEGGSGNDFIYGSNARDGLFGSEGNDLIVGGGGDDLIFGDGVVFGIGDSTDYWTWTFTPYQDGNAYGVNTNNIPYLYSPTEYPAGDDVIYGGTGNDFVYAKAGDDEVYGGEGNDTITGDMGYDLIEGGSGDDILIGCIDNFFHKKCLSKSLVRGIDNFYYRLEI